MAGTCPVGYSQSKEELNPGLPKTNPAVGDRKEDLNPGPPDYSAFVTRPARLSAPLVW